MEPVIIIDDFDVTVELLLLEELELEEVELEEVINAAMEDNTGAVGTIWLVNAINSEPFMNSYLLLPGWEVSTRTLRSLYRNRRPISD